MDLSLKLPFPWGFHDNLYHEGKLSKMSDFDVVFFLFCNVRNIKLDLMVNEKQHH